MIGAPSARSDTMPATPQEPLDVERVLMDRARRLAGRQEERMERPLLPRLVALALSLVVVVIVLFAFDRFLASMQRFMSLPVGEPEAAPSETIPAYVVPTVPTDGSPPSEDPEQPPGTNVAPDDGVRDAGAG
jgi:hypothetical protein